ncbi:MAG: serine/threonine-protein phosphatase [bacterium]|nr:serine/threonine-protein phosphatase [bacterium]
MSDTYPTAVDGLRLIHGGLSDIGRRRTRNEDSIGFFPPADRNGSFLVVVADGVGGSNAGDAASQLAVKTIGDVFFARGEPAHPAVTLHEAMQAANDAIIAQAASDPHQAGMATTCSCVVLRGNTLLIGHLGDCRVYLSSGGNLVQLTHDHSLADEYAADGRELPPDQVHLSNVLTRWLGVEGPAPVEISDVMQMNDEDTLVVCSDGLTKTVTEPEILHTVSMHLPAAACRRLVQLANDRGGPDNISLHVVRLTRF